MLTATDTSSASTSSQNYSAATTDNAHEHIAIGDTISQAWGLFKANFSLLLKVDIIMSLISLASNSIDDLTDEPSILIIIGLILFQILNILVTLGGQHIFLKVAARQPVELSALWAFKDRFWSYFGATLIYCLIVLAGTILLIVPGIVWAYTYMFAPFIIAWKKVDAGTAIRLSARMTAGYKTQLFVLSLVLLGLNILGMLALFVGLFVTIPVSYLASCLVFHKLAARIPELQTSPATQPA